MQHVPLRDRLGNSSLVSKELHAAAVEATQSLELFMPCEAHTTVPNLTGCLSSWISHYGQHLTKVMLRGFKQPLRHLSCPNLLDLELSSVFKDGSVQLGPAADGTLGVIKDCIKLTRLHMRCRIIDATVDGVYDNLSSLVDLQHLDFSGKVDTPVLGLSAATLPRLQRLAHLTVTTLSEENLVQLGGLPSLQELDLAADEDVDVGPSSVPGISFPASLSRLVLSTPVEAGILLLVPTTLRNLQVECYVESPTEGPGSFLAGMGRLQHLTQLVVRRRDPEWPPAGPTYSTLAASSNLVTLELAVTSVPQGIWSHVFGTAHKLPHLTCLSLADTGHEGGMLAASPRWGAAELSSLVSCCPGLCKIDGPSLEPGPQLSELHKLTALTRLHVWYFLDDTTVVAESVKCLAAVTQLRELDISMDRPDFPLASLLALTSLTALTYLSCVTDITAQWDPVAAAASRMSGMSLDQVVEMQLQHEILKV
jgi:hypothetical protein